MAYTPSLRTKSKRADSLRARTLQVALFCTVLGLSGCAWMWRAASLRTPLIQGSAPERPVQADAAATTPYTDAGRAYLSWGETGLAIEAFQHVLGKGEAAAPALNGLGVAYARIERYDTAQNLFQQAIALAPESEQYAANMTRLLRAAALEHRP